MSEKRLKFSRNLLIKNNLVLLIILILSVTVGCGGQNDGQSGTSKKPLSHIYEKLGPYQGWQKTRIENVVFIHPPDLSELEELQDYSRVFSAMARQVASFLSIRPPDSLTVYFYPSAKHGITVTGFLAPFADDEVIHFWLPSRIGQPVAKLMLDDWSKKAPKYKFLKEGVAALFDGTGMNYHVRTMRLLENNEYIPLSKLAVDTTINVNSERTQSALAASFVDYIVFTYGSVFFRELYDANNNFAADVEQIFKLPVDSLEKNWLDVVKRVVEEMPDSLKK